jgi:hypothetical protein
MNGSTEQKFTVAFDDVPLADHSSGPAPDSHRLPFSSLAPDARRTCL